MPRTGHLKVYSGGQRFMDWLKDKKLFPLKEIGPPGPRTPIPNDYWRRSQSFAQMDWKDTQSPFGNWYYFPTSAGGGGGGGGDDGDKGELFETLGGSNDAGIGVGVGGYPAFGVPASSGDISPLRLIPNKTPPTSQRGHITPRQYKGFDTTTDSERTRSLSYESPYTPPLDLLGSPIATTGKNWNLRLSTPPPPPQLSPFAKPPPSIIYHRAPNFEAWLNKDVSRSTDRTHRGLDDSLDLSSSLARSDDEFGSRIYIGDTGLGEELSQSLTDLSGAKLSPAVKRKKRRLLGQARNVLYPPAKQYFYRSSQFDDDKPPPKASIKKLGRKVNKGKVINPLSILRSDRPRWSDYENLLKFEPNGNIIGATVWNRLQKYPEELRIFKRAALGKGKKTEPKKHA